MTLGDVLVMLLLILGVGFVLISSLGVLVMRGTFDRLHYTDTAGFGAVLFGAAIVVREGFSEISVKAVLLAVVFLVFSPVVAHVLGRAARLRERGDLRARPHETEVDD
ncbi:MAG TPA: monovalent cation/H(+) antiporter subunit G [Rubrobacteraceae bacterium]|nr:monovalent cation/H(+) antiporter subunit G [Rubrobacteraceae bacterium]